MAFLYWDYEQAFELFLVDLLTLLNRTPHTPNAMTSKVLMHVYKFCIN